MTYTETVNHKNFREANKLVHEAKKLLKQLGMPKQEAAAWISSWSNGSGDGIQ